ncbi:hypothetical protein DSO57_1025404 [Entomophthora muscae]|uniref:Uncharacterized protein n=1 Tax=Entomophthora muscae TaxID=34485 RepID=A0ACC2TPL9_9FUNG|nr:hypothetical protein DSO57_1025404 [Entomophthora muscae]
MEPDSGSIQSYDLSAYLISRFSLVAISDNEGTLKNFNQLGEKHFSIKGFSDILGGLDGIIRALVEPTGLNLPRVKAALSILSLTFQDEHVPDMDSLKGNISKNLNSLVMSIDDLTVLFPFSFIDFMFLYAISDSQEKMGTYEDVC